MSTDTIYIVAIVVDLTYQDEVYHALATDRWENEVLGGDLRDCTNQGPLKGGEAFDIGSFRAIGERAARTTGYEFRLRECDAIEITVVIAPHHAQKLMGGYKRFDIAHAEDGRMTFTTPDILTRQIRTRWRRRRLRRLIQP
jgi:hypothetical protein